MKGIPACRCVCISMYKQMYTYICISYNIWTWIGNSHIIHITLSCQRDFFYTSRCRFTFSCWSKPLTQNTEWSASISHYLFGLFAAGQHKHPVHSSWGTACENKHTHTDTFPAAPTLSEGWDSRYWYLYLYKNKQNCNSINKLKAKQPQKNTFKKNGDSTWVGGQSSARRDCLHFRSRMSSSKDAGTANALARGGLSGCSMAASGSASKLDEQWSWTSRSLSADSEANLWHTGRPGLSCRNLPALKSLLANPHLSLLVDVNTRALGSSSVFFLLIFLCLTVPLSDFPLGSSVKPW